MGSGRGTGGSGSVNAMVYTRGAKYDYDSWNLDGWGWSALQPTFERLEKNLHISQRPPTQFTETCIAGAEAAGFARSGNLNDGTLSGRLGYNWMNIEGDKRRSAYVAYLRPREGQPNLRLVTNATVHRIGFDGDRHARTVEYEVGGQLLTATATREIVLSAGALETPKLLLLSGVGPADELRRHGIPIVADVPGIGQNLQDHPNIQVFFASKHLNDCNWAQLYGFHRADPTTPLPAGQADTCYVFYSAKSSFREGMIRMLPGIALPQPLYQMGWPKTAVRGAVRGIFGVPGVQWMVNHIYGVVVILGKPLSRGSVRLQSTDPAAQGLVDPNYFGDPRDLESLVRGVALARQIAATDTMKQYGNLELMPGSWVKTDDGVRKFIRQNVMTTYHYAGTATMGERASDPVDLRLRLRGVRGLRIVDASVIPLVPVSAMNAPSMMIGQRGADFLLEERATASQTATVSA
jgi:choline dehydrogenase